MNIEKMTTAQMKELLLAQQQKIDAMSSGLIVKRTDKGGIWIQDDSFVEWSENKIEKKVEAEKKKHADALREGKQYTKKEIKPEDGFYKGSINITRQSAKVLAENKEKRDQIINLIIELVAQDSRPAGPAAGYVVVQ